MFGSGVEKCHIKIIDPNSITDKSLYPNSLGSAAVVIDLSPYKYISDGERAAAVAGGESVKYSVVMTLILNLLLKIIMKNSMSYLWDLVHALQVWQLIALIDLNVPPNLEIFNEYLGIASGDMEEVQEVIPDFSQLLIVEEDMVVHADSLASEMLKRGVESPYVLIAFGKSLTLWFVTVGCILPMVYLLHQICRNVALWQGVLSEFFWGTPIRVFLELYVDICIALFINMTYLKFENKS